MTLLDSNVNPTTFKTKLMPLTFLLFGRLFLFFVFQVILTLVFWIFGRQFPFADSSAWWLVQVILTNITCIFILKQMMQREGLKLKNLYLVEKHTVWKELLITLGLMLVGLPLGALPNSLLAAWLFGDPSIPALMMFRPIPGWALIMGILFPLTIAFVEIPYYFAYIMPRLQNAAKLKWPITILCSLALAAQHITLPLIFDARFITWRLLMYLPFALFVGIVMQCRPRQLPYFMVIHALMDFSALAVYFTIH
jgi:hypothetical protein